MPSLKNQLNDLVKVEGINAAVVVGRDGFVIEGMHKTETWTLRQWEQ